MRLNKTNIFPSVFCFHTKSKAANVPPSVSIKIRPVGVGMSVMYRYRILLTEGEMFLINKVDKRGEICWSNSSFVEKVYHVR